MTPPLEPEILRLHGEGLSGAAISRQVGCSGPYISQVLRKHGLGASPPRQTKPRDTYWTDERVEILREMWVAGRSGGEIVKRLGAGVTRNAVIGKAHRMGLQYERPSAPVGAKVRTARPKSLPKAPRRKRVLIAGNNAVFAEPDARKPWVVVPEKAWNPLPGSTPRPWTERGLGCCWPIDIPGAVEQHACCEPKDEEQSYCPSHRALGTAKAQPAATAKGRVNELVRSLRRYAA